MCVSKSLKLSTSYLLALVALETRVEHRGVVASKETVTFYLLCKEERFLHIDIPMCVCVCVCVCG